MSKSTSAKPKKHRPVSMAPKMINPFRQVPKGATHLRDKATINRLAMYNTKARYNREGQFMGGAFMSREVDEPVKRIAPDRRWFGNTRVIGQKELERFREQMNEKMNDPYTVVLKQQALPMALLADPYQKSRPDLLSTESFEEVFGPRAQRKKPRLGESVADVATMATTVETSQDNYDIEKDDQRADFERDYLREDAIQAIFRKGTSKRIWNELYKVIDASDVVIQVLDVRDPMGTRCRRIEDELKKRDRRHKHMVLILNKCDLVPTWVTRRWVKLLSREYPTLAFHASITNPFGKGSLLQLLRQFGRLHEDKRQISIGFVGYPNVGKSSVINAVRGANVCPAAPVPGETKTWRYITLFKRIYLIDCPGVVYPFGNTPTDCVLKGVIRMEQIDDPADYIGAILDRVRSQYIVKHYGVTVWKSPADFLKRLAVKSGKLLRGGEPDITNCARIILSDWQNGRLPFFVCPPFEEDLAGGRGLFDLQKLRYEQEKQARRVTVEDEDSEDTMKDSAEEDDDEEEQDSDVDGEFEEFEEENEFFGNEDEDEDMDFEELDDEKMNELKEETKAYWEREESEAEEFDEFGHYIEDREERKKLKAIDMAKKQKEKKIESQQIVVENQDFTALPVRGSFAGADLDEAQYYKEHKLSKSNTKSVLPPPPPPAKKKSKTSSKKEVSIEPLLVLRGDISSTSSGDTSALFDLTPMDDPSIAKKKAKLETQGKSVTSGALLRKPSASSTMRARSSKK